MIKPLSVNDCWQGQRFKTPEYRAYEKALLLMLPHPNAVQIPEGPLALFLEAGQSNMGADFDNPVKPACDILCKRYGFDDRRIIEAIVRKRKVAKGDEYLIFNIVAAEEI